MKPLAPNTLLQNRYLIVHLIGKGGMGEVYLAVDQRLGSAVALKRTFFSDDEMLGTAFEREARTLARLRHSVLPKVSDHFTENDTQYLVMEHITGDDLSKRLEITNKPFPLNWVLFWADQLLDALAYLHSHEPPIVHRDIKPQNLKLTDENHIVLLDFGLAKNSTGNTRVSSTTGGSIVGYTPHYAPMEQIRGTGTNPRSDIYSFAATFYQLLTNVVPPDALSRADNVLNGLPDPTKPLYEVNAEVPRAISDVILKGMALSMEQRYASAREMQKAMREAYAQMQNAMSAQTMAFNVTPAAIQQNEPPPQSQQQTEQFSTNVANQYPAAAAPNTQPPAAASTAFDSFSEGSQSASSPLNPSLSNAYPSQPRNFDETLKDDSQPFGMKTEVLTREKMPSPESYSPDSAASTSAAATENFGADQFSSGGQEDFNPDATIAPLVNFSSQTPESRTASNFNSVPQNEANYSAGNTFPPKQNTVPPPAAAEHSFQSAPVPAEAKKKSGGKALAIAGGIGGLGVVAVGAAAIGWYALKPSQTTVQPTPTPSVAIEATVEPTAIPSPVLSMETDPNAANTSSEALSPTPEDSAVNNTDSQKNQKAVVTADKTPAPQNVQPTTPGKVVPTPRIVTAKTPPVAAKTPPPAAKTPAKPNPTDILQ